MAILFINILYTRCVFIDPFAHVTVFGAISVPGTFMEKHIQACFTIRELEIRNRPRDAYSDIYSSRMQFVHIQIYTKHITHITYN